MTIKANVINVRDRILAEPDFAKEVKDAAIRAILGGNKEWVEYMKFFQDTNKPQQLARLIPTDDTESNAAMQEARAYLVASTPCTPATVNNMVNVVGDILDEGLPD
jgi:hypothetical protein